MFKKKVLVIDDEESIRFIIENTLKQEFEVASFSNGRDGIDYLVSGNVPDFIICDLVMPEITGFEFLEQIKTSGFFNDIPVMILSGREESKDKIKCFELGAEDYVVKPFDPNEIIARIKCRIKVRERLFNIIGYERINNLKMFQLEYQKKNKKNEDKIVHPYHPPLSKRIFDIIFSFTGLLLTLPILILTAIAIRVESKGKIIYTSKRVGANFKIFNFYKFRTMYQDADRRLKEFSHLNQYEGDDEKTELIKCSDCKKLPEGEFCSPVYYYDGKRICEKLFIKRQNAKKAFVKIQNDPRITRVGKFIRNTSIDELPQLYNVLKGDMSIIGNRPLPVYEANALTKSSLSRRFRAAAGITGLWQVEIRGKGGFMSEKDRFIYDNFYALKKSFWLDLKILLRTIPALFQNSNV